MVKLLPPVSEDTVPSTVPPEVTDSQTSGLTVDRFFLFTVQLAKVTVEYVGGLELGRVRA